MDIYLLTVIQPNQALNGSYHELLNNFLELPFVYFCISSTRDCNNLIFAISLSYFEEIYHSYTARHTFENIYIHIYILFTYLSSLFFAKLLRIFPSVRPFVSQSACHNYKQSNAAISNNNVNTGVLTTFTVVLNFLPQTILNSSYLLSVYFEYCTMYRR